MQTDILIPSTPPGLATSGTGERRRPGRAAVAPNLVPLLRCLSSDGSASYLAMRETLLRDNDMVSIAEYSEEELSEPAPDFVLALRVAIPFWIVVALLTYYTV